MSSVGTRSVVEDLISENDVRFVGEIADEGFATLSEDRDAVFYPWDLRSLSTVPGA